MPAKTPYIGKLRKLTALSENLLAEDPYHRAMKADFAAIRRIHVPPRLPANKEAYSRFAYLTGFVFPAVLSRLSYDKRIYDNKALRERIQKMQQDSFALCNGFEEMLEFETTAKRRPLPRSEKKIMEHYRRVSRQYGSILGLMRRELR